MGLGESPESSDPDASRITQRRGLGAGSVEDCRGQSSNREATGEGQGNRGQRRETLFLLKKKVKTKKPPSRVTGL